MNNLIEGKASRFDYITYSTKELTLNCDTKSMHVDDKMIVPFENPIKLEVREKVLEFMI